MLATILFQVLAAGGMALLGWWLCFDDDAPHSVAALRSKRSGFTQGRQRRSAA